jgi:hypothetical protein
VRHGINCFVTNLLRSGLSLFTHRSRHDFPVLGSKPFVLMELQSRAPNCLTYSTKISSSSGIQGPFLNTSSPFWMDLRLIFTAPPPLSPHLWMCHLLSINTDSEKKLFMLSSRCWSRIVLITFVGSIMYKASKCWATTFDVFHNPGASF